MHFSGVVKGEIEDGKCVGMLFVACDVLPPSLPPTPSLYLYLSISLSLTHTIFLSISLPSSSPPFLARSFSLSLPYSFPHYISFAVYLLSLQGW